MIIIDTDVLIEIFDRNSKIGDEALKKIEESGEEVAITSINLHEILYGHLKVGKKIQGIGKLDTIEFDKRDAEVSSKIEVNAEKNGRTIPRIDTMIAAIAVNRNAKLFTYNKKHFKEIKKIRLF